MTPTNISHALNFFQSTSNIFGQNLIDVTKVLNEVTGSSLVDSFMDAAKGVGHRVEFGHSLDYLPTIYERFGITGVVDYFSHGIRDVMSPHGMPMPFARAIRDALGLRPMTAVDWLCFNIGDVLSAGLSVAHSYKNFSVMRDAVDGGYMPPELAATAAVGAMIKLGFGLTTTNAVSIGSGLFDLGTMIWALHPALSLGSAYFTGPAKITTTTILTGAVSGAATAAGIGGALHAITDDNIVTWVNRLKKMGFAGGVGGFVGVGSASVSASPVVISAAAIGGYVAADWLYDNIEDLVADWFRQPESDLLPDFLAEVYAPNLK